MTNVSFPVFTHNELFGAKDQPDEPVLSNCQWCGDNYSSDEATEYDGLCPMCSRDAKELNIDPGADLENYWQMPGIELK